MFDYTQNLLFASTNEKYGLVSASGVKLIVMSVRPEMRTIGGITVVMSTLPVLLLVDKAPSVLAKAGEATVAHAVAIRAMSFFMVDLW